MDNRRQHIVDFIGIGAARCGTTWISQCLREHPEICLSSPKETHYFDRYASSGIAYESFFSHCKIGQLRGEFTPSYYLDESIAKEIRRINPDVKIIVSLRNPVERTFSHYVYDKRRFGTPRTFCEFLKRRSRGVADGFYYRHLSRFLRHFNEQNVLILIYEDSLVDSLGFIRRIYEFLGVGKEFVPESLTRRTNTSHGTGYHIPQLNRAMRSFRRTVSKIPGGRFVRSTARMSGIGRGLQRVNRQRGVQDIETLDEKTRTDLRDLYADDIARLEHMLGRKLTVWR